MAQRPHHLAAQHVPVVAEVAFERVLVQHDPVLVVAARDAVAVVVAIGAELLAALRHDDRHVLERLLELRGQLVDRVGHEQLELGRLAGQLRELGELLGADHDALELLLARPVVAHEADRDPGGAEDEHDRGAERHQQAHRAGHLRRVDEEQEDHHRERRDSRRTQDVPNRVHPSQATRGRVSRYIRRVPGLRTPRLDPSLPEHTMKKKAIALIPFLAARRRRSNAQRGAKLGAPALLGLGAAAAAIILRRRKRTAAGFDASPSELSGSGAGTTAAATTTTDASSERSTDTPTATNTVRTDGSAADAPGPGEGRASTLEGD